MEKISADWVITWVALSLQGLFFYLLIGNSLVECIVVAAVSYYFTDKLKATLLALKEKYQK